jgi:hypothetical protein
VNSARTVALTTNDTCCRWRVSQKMDVKTRPFEISQALDGFAEDFPVICKFRHLNIV